MIKIIPAIDLINGECVRLKMGDFDQKTIYSENPLAVARQFEKFGAQRLHIVDLDAAKSGNPANTALIAEIAQQTKLKVDVGGGIKTSDQIEQLLSLGIQAVNIGSEAFKSPENFKKWLKKFGSNRIWLSADTRNRKIAINGWQKSTNQPLITFITEFLPFGLRRIVVTPIEKDGMMSGPDITLYKSLTDQFPHLEIIASGGVTSLKDLEALENANVAGAIVGKALYENPQLLQHFYK